jgi:hypothetical protein
MLRSSTMRIYSTRQEILNFRHPRLELMIMIRYRDITTHVRFLEPLRSIPAEISNPNHSFQVEMRLIFWMSYLITSRENSS